ncbi:MAG: hypothetical protein M3209_20190 [Acidobacteriota bacterium]|nr:hypothetical protein [Acidobacteriota bacterium]
MITGFNTDIEYGGVTYHVQTEDKGLDTPLILSLVYSGGEILASKRSPYDDLIAAGFDEKALSERLNRQHKLICAAINQGRIDDLKRMSIREPLAEKTVKNGNVEQSEKAERRVARIKEAFETVESVEVVQATETPVPVVEIVPTQLMVTEIIETCEPVLEIPVEVVDEADEVELETGFEEPIELPQTPALLRAHLGEIEPTKEDLEPSLINIRLFEEREYRGGDRVELKIQVTNDINIPLANVEIMVKVLGSSFRPLIFHARTGKKGTAAVNLQLPHFRSGRAALLVRAIVEDREVELRRIINQG